MLAGLAWALAKIRGWFDRLEGDALNSYNADRRRR